MPRAVAHGRLHKLGQSTTKVYTSIENYLEPEGDDEEKGARGLCRNTLLNYVVEIGARMTNVRWLRVVRQGGIEEHSVYFYQLLLPWYT